MKKRILIISGPCLITYGIVPVAVDPEDSDGMKRMAEFICRVNYGLHCIRKRAASPALSAFKLLCQHITVYYSINLPFLH